MTVDLSQLDVPFSPDDIEWRIQSSGMHNGKPWARVLAYVTNRAIMERLDQVVGRINWRNEFAPGPHGGVVCGISIRVDEEWITKWDGADNTDIESVKGGLSNAMKRAAVQWGIGRYLYRLEEGFAQTSTEKQTGPQWYHAKTKDGTFWWCPPALPSSALPSGYGKPPAQQTDDKRPTDKATDKYELHLGGPLRIACKDQSFLKAWGGNFNNVLLWVSTNGIMGFSSWDDARHCDDEQRLKNLFLSVTAETKERLAKSATVRQFQDAVDHESKKPVGAA